MASGPARYIARRQAAFPPRYQRRREAWEALFRGALRLAPEQVQQRYQRGAIASGEIGELSPATYVTPLLFGQAIEMHSGEMRLIYSAARMMFATDAGRFRGQSEPALTVADVARNLADLFRNYARTGAATVQRFPVSENQAGWAHNIALHAEIFLLMHELGHIHNEHTGLASLLPRNALDRERSADLAAAHWLIRDLLHPGPASSNPQVFYAGAEFGLRVRQAMELVGGQFGLKLQQTHPPAGDRIGLLRALLCAQAGPRGYYEIAGMSLASDQLWRAVEALLSDQPPEETMHLDDVLSSLRTLAVELIRAGGGAGKLIKISPVAGEPGVMQASLALDEPLAREIFEEARSFVARLDPDMRARAGAHIEDVFERGSLEYSLFLAFLNAADS
jgi:hypothetical protein